MTNKIFFFKGLLRFVNLVSTLSRLDPALAMYIVKYEELRYVVAEHTADESLRLALVDTSFVFFHRAVAINISLTIGLGNCIWHDHFNS